MRRVILLGYFFSETERVGALRIRGLANYLPRFGWEPIVITPRATQEDKSRFNIEESPHEDVLSKWRDALGIKKGSTLKQRHAPEASGSRKVLIDRITDTWEEIFAYPDYCRTWIEPAVSTARRIIRHQDVDAVVSSSSPVTSHIVAARLAKEHDLNWVADFRDLWTQNHYYPYSPIRRMVERRLEKVTIERASGLTTISQPLATRLSSLHSHKPVHVIPNGFDPSEIRTLPDSERIFTVSYTGYLYKGKRDPSLLFRALRSLSDKGDIDLSCVSVRFYGPNEDWLRKEAKVYDLQDVVHDYGLVTRSEAIEAQRRSHILLLLTWDNPEEVGVTTGKLYDYLAARRPIVSIGPAGSILDNLLRSTGAGRHVSNLRDAESAIGELYREHRDFNEVAYRGNEEEINRYSHIEMASKFSEVLHNLDSK